MKLFEHPLRDIFFIVVAFAVFFGVLVGTPKLLYGIREYQKQQARAVVEVPLSAEEKKMLEREIVEIQNAIRASDKKGERTYTKQYLALGEKFEKLGFLKRALHAYTKALHEDARDLSAMIHTADVNQRMKNFEEAENWYRKVIDREPTNTRHYQKLADMYFYDRNNPESARGIYLEGLLRTQNDISLLKVFASFLELSGDRREASLYWDAVLQKEPQNKEVEKHLKSLQEVLSR